MSERAFMVTKGTTFEKIGSDVVDYQVINDESVDGLVGQTRDLIVKGENWEPVGGICAVVVSTPAWGGSESQMVLFYQAMVKKAIPSFPMMRYTK